MMDLMKGNAWKTLERFIRSVSKFLTSIEKREIRIEFEEYLTQDYKSFSERCVVPSEAQQIDTDGKNDWKPEIRRILNKTVKVDCLVDDLCFFMECERFRRLADAGDVMRSEGTYRETDYAMLHQKADVIINIYLLSVLPPKLLINISEAQKDAILQRFASGKVDHTLFYLAMMDVFPVLIFCWKRFCSVKVMKQFYPNKAEKNRAVRSCPAEQRPIDIQQIKTVRSNEVKDATLHFSTQHGLTLLLPQTPH